MPEPKIHELASSRVFEELCRDILIAEGCKNVRGLGTGPDQGSDIMIDVPHDTPLGVELVPYIVQCKWVTSAVGQDVIGDVLSYLPLHRAQGLLIISAAGFSGTAVTKANAISQEVANPYKVRLWTESDLQRKLQKYPWLISKFWYRENDGYGGKAEVDIYPKYERSSLLRELDRKPVYDDANVDWYKSVTGYNEDLRSRVIEFVDRFSKAPPVLTLIRGAIGSGKTCLAYVLLHAVGDAISCLDWYAFNEIYYAYMAAGDDRLPRLIGVLADLDFLIIDDCGYHMPEGSEPSAPAQVMLRVIEERLRERRPTIVIMVGYEEAPAMISQRLAWWGHQYPLFDLGPRSWRAATLQKTAERQVDEPRRYSGFLSEAWLDEKLGMIETQVERGMHCLGMPDEELISYGREIEIRGYGAVTREGLAQDVLRGVLKDVRRYKEFVTSLPWSHIRFDDVEFGANVSSKRWFVIEGDVHDECEQEPNPGDEGDAPA